MNKLILILFEGLCTSIACCFSSNDFERRVVITMKWNESGIIIQDLEVNNFRLLNKVIQNNYIFEYQGMGNTSELNELISRLKTKYKDMIVAIERVVVYNDTLKPGGVTKNHKLDQLQNDSGSGHENYYGMGVRRAWLLGYTGKGVTVAVTDVGIHTGLVDLKNNIEDAFCYNFINDSKNITPEFFHNLQAESSMFTDHGDHCASLIASAYGNEICSSGIAFNATVVGLKIYMVKLIKGIHFDIVPRYSSRSDIVARALAYNHTIDIYSNAWAPTDPFVDLDTLTKEVLKRGAENGRRGLGIIYVFPAGPVGNGFANSIYTTAVNGVGQYGRIHKDSTLSASVITSGLTDGSNITASYMLTTSSNNKCVTSFNGVSPATAQIAAIIGLALE
ncbi:neuroendocrine convertase 2-like isoform X1 [Mercenaria mercenaria]|uniref:neuroendocrine convertase 2-like isoform X1 n=1 Tax=Mercenaria mercenaria TaxID=6596 RepID=UPI00234E3C38|nr:neuroendocrine convertase 2-like isoform X1 [Mercenaria mercenaria]